MTSPAMKLRSAEDVLAAVRVVLGFEPHDSLVMITLGGRHPLQARVDLPASHRELDAGLDALASQLLEPVRRFRAGGVLLVAYTDDERLGRRALRGLVRRFLRSGVDVADALRSDGCRWYPLDHDRPGLSTAGVPYDVGAHPFVVAAVVEGRVVHGSRGDLVESLRPDPVAVAEVEAVAAWQPGSAAWVLAQVERYVADATTPTAHDAARLLHSIAVTEVREAVWTSAVRSTAPVAVRFWTDLVRRAPDGLVAHAAAVLAFHCWLSGDGALAWCAVDRCVVADPDHPLAGLVSDLLMAAFPPHEWEATRDALGLVS
jgi:hypothetical protein